MGELTLLDIKINYKGMVIKTGGISLEQPNRLMELKREPRNKPTHKCKLDL